jgi:hypothetical protein
MGRKIVQIAAGKEDGRLQIFALADDGTLWRIQGVGALPDPASQWERLPDLPELSSQEIAGRKAFLAGHSLMPGAEISGGET